MPGIQKIVLIQLRGSKRIRKQAVAALRDCCSGSTSSVQQIFDSGVKPVGRTVSVTSVPIEVEKIDLCFREMHVRMLQVTVDPMDTSGRDHPCGVPAVDRNGERGDEARAPLRQLFKNAVRFERMHVVCVESVRVVHGLIGGPPRLRSGRGRRRGDRKVGRYASLGQRGARAVRHVHGRSRGGSKVEVVDVCTAQRRNRSRSRHLGKKTVDFSSARGRAVAVRLLSVAECVGITLRVETNTLLIH